MKGKFFNIYDTYNIIYRIILNSEPRMFIKNESTASEQRY